eukprot:g2315.t1
MKLVLACATVGAAQAFVTPTAFTGASLSAARTSSGSTRMSLADYKEELAETAKKIAGPGKGILAVDESTNTIGKRLASIGVDNTEENRQAYRGMLFTTPDLGDYISGAILYEETLFQNHADGTPFVDCLKKIGVIPGIKVDTGLSPLPGGHEVETWCSGLDGLVERAKNAVQPLHPG